MGGGGGGAMTVLIDVSMIFSVQQMKYNVLKERVK